MTVHSSLLHEVPRISQLLLTLGLVAAANAIAVAAAIMLGERLGATSATTISVLALFVYFETFVAIVWYTIETRRTQQAVTEQAAEVATQTRLSILPAFVMEFGIKPVDLSDPAIEINEYYLHSLGRGIALNISIERKNYVEESYPNARITFDRTLVIQPGERRKVSYTQSLGEPSAARPPVDLATRLKDGPLPFQEYEYHLEFDDVLGNRYSQVLHITSRGCLPLRIRLVSSAGAA